MDHNSPAVQKCSDRQCAHGKCLNHSPNWETIGTTRNEPDPDFFGIKKTSWTVSCCGKQVTLIRKIYQQRCARCGRQENFRIASAKNAARGKYDQYGICLCCGRTKEFHGIIWKIEQFL